jgi:hypothetical protein
LSAASTSPTRSRRSTPCTSTCTTTAQLSSQRQCSHSTRQRMHSRLDCPAGSSHRQSQRGQPHEPHLRCSQIHPQLNRPWAPGQWRGGVHSLREGARHLVEPSDSEDQILAWVRTFAVCLLRRRRHHHLSHLGVCACVRAYVGLGVWEWCVCVCVCVSVCVWWWWWGVLSVLASHVCVSMRGLRSTTWTD